MANSRKKIQQHHPANITTNSSTFFSNSEKNGRFRGLPMGGNPMGYNKQTAENEWMAEWEKKEKILREHDCSEDLIQELKAFEKKQFNRDRKFYEHLEDHEDDFIERQPALPPEREVRTIDDIFNIVEDTEVLKLLRKTEREVLIFFVLRANDYKIEEIADKLHMTTGEIYGRVYRFRQKISKKRKK